MLQPHKTNVPELLRLQELNRSFNGPREVLEYEIGALAHLVHSLASFRAETIFPQSYAATVMIGDRIDQSCSGVARIRVATTRFNDRCGKFMICMEFGDFWNLDFRRPDDTVGVLHEAASIVTAAAVQKGPITVPILAIEEFVVEK